MEFLNNQPGAVAGGVMILEKKIFYCDFWVPDFVITGFLLGDAGSPHSTNFLSEIKIRTIRGQI